MWDSLGRLPQALGLSVARTKIFNTEGTEGHRVERRPKTDLVVFVVVESFPEADPNVEQSEAAA
jgi:hypothetical protein